jgi:hypothetical protein
MRQRIRVRMADGSFRIVRMCARCIARYEQEQELARTIRVTTAPLPGSRMRILEE